MSVAENISFGNFCQLCTKISEASQDKKMTLLQNYIDCWKKKAKELEKVQPNINSSFYPVLRFLLPQLDRERNAFGIKEHTLAKIYIRILSLPKEGSDAMKFLEYRAPKNRAPGGGTNDFAEVAYWILKRRCTEGGQLSIHDVDNHLDEIANKHASNEPHGADAELISLLKATSAEEQKWLIRILLKNMQLGIGQNAILKSYHPDAKDLYESNNNLKKVCDLLKDSGTRLHEIEIQLFSPLKPMLSEECDLQKLDAYLKRSSYFYIETKLDGERFQLHKSGEDYKFFSRNGYDYTSNFGATRFEGILTPRIAYRFTSDVTSCILDGEMMSWNFKIGMYATKANNIDVKHLKENNTYQPCFCVFDILYYNGQVLTNQPLNCRLEILSKVINPLDGAICFVPRSRVSSKKEIVDSLNKAIDNREEGIVMKEFMSVYKPNVRRNGGWYKIKPEYIDGLADTLDLLILGGYFGSGRHQGKLSHFLLGVAVSVEDDAPLFYTVARVGSGYSLRELGELQNKLEPFWKPVYDGEMPQGIAWTKEKPDFWIPPDKSFVLEIKAAEIIASKSFKTESTLRFPRVERVRYDKSWKDCLTLKEFEERRKMASGKLTSHYATFDESQNSVSRKKSQRSSVVLGSQYQYTDTSDVQCISNLLADKEICVFTGFDNVKKRDVERKITEFGGSVVQNPGKNTSFVLAEYDSTTRIKNIIKSGGYDVIKTSWLYGQLNEKNTYLPQFKLENFVAPSLETQEIFSKLYDEYGDHYSTPLTKKSLQHLVEATKKNCENSVLSLNEKYDIDVELFSGPSPYGFFRLCFAYFDCFHIIGDPTSGLLPDLETVKLEFKFFGGRCSDFITNETTHVILFSRDLSRLKEFNHLNVERKCKFRIVTEKWVFHSIKDKALSGDFGFEESFVRE